MTTLHWKVREYAKELREDGRLTVLTMLILHANVRLRCWPGTDLIAEESGWSVPSVVKAKQWLVEHKAIELVDYKKRVGEECNLPRRQYVYQLTGTIEINGKTWPYLYVPEPETKVSETSPTEISPTLAKGIPISEGLPESSAPSRGVENAVPEQQPLIPDEAQETPEPVTPLKEESGDSEKKEAAAKKTRPANPLFDAVAEHYFNAPPGSERVTAISGRVGVVLKALRTIDPNLTPDRIKESAALFRKKNPGCTMPKGKDTVADAYSAWLEARRQATAAPRPGQRRLNVSDAADSHYDVWTGQEWKRETQGISP